MSWERISRSRTFWLPTPSYFEAKASSLRGPASTRRSFKLLTSAFAGLAAVRGSSRPDLDRIPNDASTPKETATIVCIQQDDAHPELVAALTYPTTSSVRLIRSAIRWRA